MNAVAVRLHAEYDDSIFVEISMRALASFLCIVMTATFCLAQASTGPAAKGEDALKEAVDPYDAGLQRNKFFIAAGVDGLLSEADMTADAARAGSFARPFDRWKNMLAFDKDNDGKLDWFEADAYRSALRKKVLDTFDADKNAKLSDKERQQAADALARGGVSLDALQQIVIIPAGAADEQPKPRPADAPPTRPAVDPRQQEQMPPLKDAIALAIKRNDANGDGMIDKDELKAADQKRQAEMAEIGKKISDLYAGGKQPGADKMNEFKDAYREVSQRMYHIHVFRQADSNKDGMVSQAEEAAYQRAIDLSLENADQRMKDYVKKYDKDGDGKVSTAEAIAASKDRFLEQMLEHYDFNNNGAIDEDEEAQAQKDKNESIAASKSIMKAYTKRYDKDGDGKISSDETKAALEDMQRRHKKHVAGQLAKLDTDGDGQVSFEETKKAAQAMLKKYDADSDGRLDRDEMTQALAREFKVAKAPPGVMAKVNIPIYADRYATIFTDVRGMSRSMFQTWEDDDKGDQAPDAK